jgi:hypothetical protein
LSFADSTISEAAVSGNVAFPGFAAFRGLFGTAVGGGGTEAGRHFCRIIKLILFILAAAVSGAFGEVSSGTPRILEPDQVLSFPQLSVAATQYL